MGLQLEVCKTCLPPTMSKMFNFMCIVVVVHIFFLGICMVVDIELPLICEFRNWQSYILGSLYSKYCL
jgi:type IV secretory pathway VirB6-like protein